MSCTQQQQKECIIILIITIISQRLGLTRPALTLSNRVFRGLPTCLHLLCNSPLFLPFCFCPFLLHVAAIFICIFLVSLQLVELSALKKIISFVVKNCASYCFSENLHLHWCQLFFIHPNFNSIEKNGYSQYIIYLYLKIFGPKLV